MWILLTCLLFGGPSLVAFSIHESTRWMVCSKECTKQRESNTKLVNTEMCSNAWERRKFGPSVEETCTKAEHELDLSHLSCTAQMFWKQSVFYELYALTVGSPLFLFIGVLVIILFTIYQIFSYLATQKQEERTERMYNSALDRFSSLPAMLPPAPIAAKEEPKKNPIKRSRSLIKLARPLPSQMQYE